MLIMSDFFFLLFGIIKFLKETICLFIILDKPLISQRKIIVGIFFLCIFILYINSIAHRSREKRMLVKIKYIKEIFFGFIWQSNLSWNIFSFIHASDLSTMCVFSSQKFLNSLFVIYASHHIIFFLTITLLLWI